MTTRQQQDMCENINVDLRLEKLEKTVNILKEKHLNDQNVINQVSNQMDVLLKEKESLITCITSMTNELTALKSKVAKLECKYLH